MDSTTVEAEAEPTLETGSQTEPNTGNQDRITDLDQAKAIALRRLTTRARSRAELKQDLIRKRVDESVADQVITRFTEVGLLDDAGFARAWVEERRESKSLSQARLRQELLGKGIEPALIDQALGTTAETEAGLALDWARRRARTMAGLDRQTQIRRLTGQLERRGFTPAVVRRAVLQVVDEDGS